MAQLELMNAAANVTTKEDLDALKLTLSLFFAELAQRAIDKLWDEGKLDQAKLDELRGQHLRKFVDCAIAASADYIVTEDNHFNRLKSIPFPRTRILTLDEFNAVERYDL